MSLGPTLNVYWDTTKPGRPDDTLLLDLTSALPSSFLGMTALDTGIALNLWPRATAVGSQVTTTQRLANPSAMVFTGFKAGSHPSSTQLFYVSGFTEGQDENGNWCYTATLNLNTDEIIAAIGSRNYLPVRAQILNAGLTYGQQSFTFPAVMYAAGYNPAGLINPSTARRGTFAIGSGVDSGTVTGLALPSVPAQVLVSMKKLAGGLNLFAIVRSDSVTTDGFTFDLSAATDSASYQLDYLVLL